MENRGRLFFHLFDDRMTFIAITAGDADKTSPDVTVYAVLVLLFFWGHELMFRHL
jgi:hypothetical protein